MLQEYREAMVISDKDSNTNNIDNIIQVRRAEKAARRYASTKNEHSNLQHDLKDG